MQNDINGIDISHYQGEIDWEKVANYGIQFSYFKCTEGAIINDLSSIQNAQSAIKCGMNVGYYHFAFPQKKLGDATDEANFFIKNLKTFPKPTLQYPYVLDIEKNPENLSQQQYYNWIKEFMFVFKNYSNSPLMIYGSPNFLNSVLPHNHSLGSNPLWIAHYNIVTPRLPNGWKKWTVWQFTDKGKINGINTPVDRNVLNQ